MAVLLGGIGLVHFDGLNSSQIADSGTAPELIGESAEPITPIPLSISLDHRKVALGERLFHEARLSADGKVPCAHCHSLNTGGVDHLPRSRGVGGQEGGINAPTVFNSGFNSRQFWDGRAETLEDQVDGPLQNPLEMAGSWPKAVAMLSQDPSYGADFSAIYPDGINQRNMKDAIATFEFSLITPNARFDQYLRGNLAALTEVELAGYRLFRQIGCTSCHQGRNIGGNLYGKLGIMEDYFAGRSNQSKADQGRFNVTKLERDRYFFRVPSLRNVAVTGPYLHDASAPSLEDTVRIMARYQLGQNLNAQDVDSITAFLRTLTGEYLGERLQ